MTTGSLAGVIIAIVTIIIPSALGIFQEFFKLRNGSFRIERREIRITDTTIHCLIAIGGLILALSLAGVI